MFKKVLKFIINKLRNKYILVTTLFVLWMLFFDRNDVMYQIELTQKINELKDTKQYYLDQITKDSTETEELMSDPKNLEKFAREKYLMKKDSEDIFLIVKE